MTLIDIVILAVVQGLAELLPVSSSAHVIAIAKLRGIKDTSTPEFVLMLVMLHTGTMFAVIVYFWKAWKQAFFSSSTEFVRFATKIVIATGITGTIYLGIRQVIKMYLKHKNPSKTPEVEDLFKHLDLLAAALAAAGALILFAGLGSKKTRARKSITTMDSIAIGAIQGVCLPFRGFSRSGATISVGLLRGMARV